MISRQTKPRVFLSSTIRDFEDLRSALKFWLEEVGFDVQASNYPDFEHPPDADTIEACLQNVRSSDYYVLLLGERLGWYLEDRRASVTQLEYREAIEGLRSRGRPHVIPLVRESLLTKIESTRETGHDEELARICSFLDEVRGVGKEVPLANWTIPFRTFRDAADGIKSTISVARSPLARQAVLENLRREFEFNLLPLMTKHDGQPFFGSWWLEAVRGEIKLVDIGPDSTYKLNAKQVEATVIYITVGVARPDVFVQSALADAITSGALLDYDNLRGSYLPSRLLEHLYDLREQIALCERRVLSAALRERWYRLHDESRHGHDQLVHVSGVDLLCIFGLHDVQRNIERLLLSILFFIYSGEMEDVVLRHSTPVEDQREQMDRERVTQAELSAWLSQNHIVLRSALRDVSPDERERMRRVRARTVDVLGEERAKEFLAARQPAISKEELVALQQVFKKEGFIDDTGNPKG